MQPNFLFVRFNEGAAGKFLLSLLMGSQSVAHFNQSVEENKTIDQLLTYVHDSFSILDLWLKTEPNPVIPWNIHWISNKMDRGSSQPIDKFITQLQSDASEYFWKSVNLNKHILIVNNKPVPPVAYQNLAPVVIINDQSALKFLRKSIWFKHYGVRGNKIYLKINNPEMYPEPTRSIMKRFDNPMFVDESVFSFYRRVLWGNPNTKFFASRDNFPKNSIFINLSEILDITKLVPAIDLLCNQLGIAPVDHRYIHQAHAHWIGLHTFKF